MNEPFLTTYTFNGIIYQVQVTYRPRMRNINYRYDYETMTFKINAPLYTSKKRILTHLDKFAPNLIKRAEKHNKMVAITSTYVYIFGRPTPYLLTSKNIIKSDHLEIKNKTGLNQLLKTLLTGYIAKSLQHYEVAMNTHHYKFTVRNMSSRYGSNRRNKRALSFALSLIHFSPVIIDSVIIHELAHDKHFDHSQNFYQLLYQYCPNYKTYQKALNSKDFSYGIK